MPTTSCDISDHSYHLDYTKVNSKRGTYYFGKIHGDPVTGFAFTALSTGGYEFDDARESLNRQEAIVTAITKHQAQIML